MNASGSWQLFKLETCSAVRQSNIVKLPTCELVVNTMKRIASEEIQNELPMRLGAEIAEQQ